MAEWQRDNRKKITIRQSGCAAEWQSGRITYVVLNTFDFYILAERLSDIVANMEKL